ncbi:hypothetical protein WR25_03414 [Diploscapter pachys]|uniref:Decapping nuclease n=1 Tax=Diploscapter pachys TaxID=2018661 RepID=A0A2A2LTD4_9BILA|nr:hypothetical protein WR25_03414 [Diploscapter pachys]
MAYEIEISSNLSDYARENAEMITSKVGKFSVDGSRSILHDDSSLRYLYNEHMKKANFNVDLNQGYKAYIERVKDNDELDILLNWLNRRFPIGGNLKQQIDNADFVLHGDILSKIATSLYDKSTKWAFQAIRIKNIIFIQEVPYEATTAPSQLAARLETIISITPVSPSTLPALAASAIAGKENPKSPKKSHQTEEEKQTLYTKAKFVQYMTIEKPGMTPVTITPINHKQAYVNVFHSSLIGSDGRRLEIFYSTEIDAIDKNGRSHQLEVIKGGDVSTSYWATEMKRIWMNLHLIGGAGLVLGHCSVDWMMNKISQFSIDQIEKKSNLNANACRALLFRVLNVVNTNIPMDGDTCTVKISDDHVILFQKPGNATEFVDTSFLANFS